MIMIIIRGITPSFIALHMYPVYVFDHLVEISVFLSIFGFGIENLQIDDHNMGAQYISFTSLSGWRYMATISPIFFRFSKTFPCLILLFLIQFSV